jgi:hypothetical protein
MEEFLNQTAVQVVGFLLATGLMTFFGWMLRRSKEQFKLRLYVYGVIVPYEVQQYLLKECGQAVVDGIRKAQEEVRQLQVAPEEPDNGRRDMSNEHLGVVIRSALQGTAAFRSLRVEKQTIYNDAEEPASASVQNLGQGTVFITTEAAEFQVYAGPFEATLQIPSGQSIDVYHISPIMKFDRLTGSTGLIVVRENGKLLPVRNRRYDLESSAASRYLPRKARARALFAVVDILEGTFFATVFSGSLFLFFYFAGKVFGFY